LRPALRPDLQSTWICRLRRAQSEYRLGYLEPQQHPSRASAFTDKHDARINTVDSTFYCPLRRDACDAIV